MKSASLKKKVSVYHSEPRLQKVYGVKDDGRFGISTKIQVIFDNLLERNAIFKQNLENLNIKLANLKPKLESLKTGLVRFFDLAFSIAESKNKLAKQKQEAQAQDNIPIDALAKNQAAITIQTPALTSSPLEVTPTRLGQSSSSPLGLWIPILSVILVMSLLSGLYVRRKLKNYHPISTLGSSAVEKKPVVEPEALPTQRAVIDQVMDVSVVEAEFSGSIPDAEPEVAIDLVKKEEVEQALEQAKIYINLNRMKEAIMLLKTQIQETPKAALHHWFCLLDLYRKSNQKEDFLDNAKQLHENFNVMMPQWEKTTYPILAASSLEELPHIIEKLTEVWGAESKVTENMVKTKAYLDELLMDNRSTERIGFGIEVFQEIMLLRDMLDIRLKLSLED